MDFGRWIHMVLLRIEDKESMQARGRSSVAQELCVAFGQSVD